MTVDRLEAWLHAYSSPEYMWFVKRLSANDTLANDTHQAGPYIPKDLLFRLFPKLHDKSRLNPFIEIDLRIDSHSDARRVKVIWYNGRLFGKTRNETRITRLGGRSSAMLDPESTGAIAVLAFALSNGEGTGECHVWVCEAATEEDLIEASIGPVEPGEFRVRTGPGHQALLAPVVERRATCFLSLDELPSQWLVRFPTGEEIVQKAIDLRGDIGDSIDARLMSRRLCEFEIFRSLEEAVELPRVMKGFDTLQDFLATAQTVLQRRKARSGRSLEIHTRRIFFEEGLKEDVDFSYLKESELGRQPDFIFPSIGAYRDPAFPSGRLRMLAVKTTTRDRWRQILEEANRIPVKHLLTLQEGVSETQFRQMREASVKLVVPQGLVSTYPPSVQEHLQTFESFMGDLRVLNPSPA